MRLFLTIDLSEELKKEIRIFQKRIELSHKIKTIPKKNLHLTLKFLGKIEDYQKIITLLENITFKPFTINTKNTGFFPSKNFINTIWIGIEEKEELLSLHKIIEKTLSRFKKDNQFTPHITVARIKKLSVEEKNKIKETSKKPFKKINFKVKSFKLMKSELSSEGSTHSILKEFLAKGL